MFAKSKNALSDLQQILHCSKCGQQSEELMCLGDCQHWFCRSCAKSNAGFPCTVCGIPSVARKTHVDIQLSNVASLCSQMMKLINGGTFLSVAGDISTSSSLSNTKNGISENESLSTKKSGRERRKKPRFYIGEQEDKATKDSSGNVSTSNKRRKKATKVEGTDLKNKNVAESLNGNSFVNLKENKEKSRDGTSLAAVPNIFDTMTELITPISSKRRSQSSSRTPKNSGRKVKKNSEIVSDLNITPQTNWGKQLSKNATESWNYSETGLAVVRKMTPQSTKKNQANLCKRNAKGETPLQVATIKMNIDEVRRLLEAGANPNVKDHAGWTPLHEAVGRGKSDIAALLIASGASVNAPGMDNLTPLHEAVVYQYTNCVQLLIDNGADMFCRNVHGYSSIDLAQKDEIKNLLLETSQTRSISDVDVPLVDESSKPLCFTGSNLSKEQTKLLTEYSRALQAKVVQQVTPDVTHLITAVNEDGSCPRTFKYLSAIVTGKWIVDIQWLETCHKQKFRAPEQDFQVSGSTYHPKSTAPKRALENRLKQLPPLLDGCQVFFYGKFESMHLRKEELANLVRQGGGVVLKREPHLHTLDDYPYTHPYHAQNSASLADCTIYVIYQDTCNSPPSVQASRMACLPASWLVDSIDTFSLLDKRIYVPL